MVDWSLLDEEILCYIVLKLDSVEDVIYFSVVCHSWYNAYSMSKMMWTPKIPWLMLPENTQEHLTCHRKLLCLGNKKCYDIKLTETFGARCWGTTSGWIVTLDPNLEIFLFNPFTRVQIRLPPQTAIQNQPEEVGNEYPRERYLDRVFVFNGDGQQDDIIVMALVWHNYNSLIYARLGDEAWKSIINREYNVPFMVDVLCRGSKILILHNDGAIRYYDMGKIQISHPVMVLEYLPPLPEEIMGFLGQKYNGLYLLDSFGDLLMIYRIKDIYYPIDYTNWDDYYVRYQTISFEVCKLNPLTKKWNKVNDLGDVALFLGNNCSMSLFASENENCKRNCIYFTDDLWQFWGSPPCEFWGHDMGIFHMEDGVIEQVYEGDNIHTNFCSALWFLPKFF